MKQELIGTNKMTKNTKPDYKVIKSNSNMLKEVFADYLSNEWAGKGVLIEVTNLTRQTSKPNEVWALQAYTLNSYRGLFGAMKNRRNYISDIRATVTAGEVTLIV